MWSWKRKSSIRDLRKRRGFFDENKEPQIGFSIEDIAKKLLGDDYTEDWYPEEEQERDRRNMIISSYKDNNEMERLLMML